MGAQEPSAVIELLTRRSEFLDALREGPRRKPDLVDETNVSRSTIDRAVRELELSGFVERTPDGFRLTLCGELVLDSFQTFREELDALYRSRSLTAKLPPDCRIGPSLLRDAEMILAEAQVPMKPVVRFEEVVSEACDIRGFSPAILPSYVDLFHAGVLEDGMSVELVLEPGVVQRLASSYAGELHEVLATDRVTICESGGTLPFGLVIADGERVGVVVYEGYSVEGVIVNDTDAALAWANDVYRDVRERAQRMPDPVTE